MPSEVERRGFWREPGGEPTSRTIAFEAWALAAREILTETAQTYHATISDTDLAEAVQVRTNIRTSQGNWLGTVLLPVIHLCHREDEPPLTSLVLQSRDGMVGEGYDEVLRVEEQRPITDPAKREHHAAVSRLECYRWAGSAPAGRRRAPASRRRPSRGGGHRLVPRRRAPTSTGTAAKKPAAAKRVAMSDRPIAVCPTCFMALPATGICDDCDAPSRHRRRGSTDQAAEVAGGDQQVAAGDADVGLGQRAGVPLGEADADQHVRVLGLGRSW